MKQTAHVSQRSLHHRVKRHARLLVVPHRHNKYQPYLIRARGIAITVAMVFAVQAVYNTTNTGSVLGDSSNVTVSALLAQTNREREQAGERPLVLNEKLAAAASMKVQDMYTEQYWAHNSPSGITPWKWLNDASYSYATAGENLAKSFHTTDGVIRAWMNSPEHRENVLNDSFKDVGFSVRKGVLNGENTTVVVALYGAPKTMAVVESSATPVLAASDSHESLMAQLGTRLQRMSSVALASILLLCVAAIVALIAHSYRKKLPRSMLKTWRRHHGAYKAVGMVSLAVMFIALYGGGQI